MKKNHEHKFKTPEGYFESFNERLMDKIAKEESAIPKTDGFAVPDGYFDTVHETIAKKIDPNAPKVISLVDYKKFFYAAASIAAILVLVFYLSPSKVQPIQFEDLASTEIDTYFENTEIGLSSYEIVQVVDLDASELNDINDNTMELEEEVIIDYLDSNIGDFEELNLEYEFEE